MTYGANTIQVEALLSQLPALPPADWKRLEVAHAAWESREDALDALAEVLAREGLRESWFELRAHATVVAKQAAADYAAQTGEGVRTIEHVASVNAWDGQREKSKVEVLGPAHELGFIDSAADALGVTLMRPYVPEKDFTRFWSPFEPILGLPG